MSDDHTVPIGDHARRLLRCGSLLSDLGEDELCGVERLLDKLLTGKRDRGPLVLATDPRDWREEARAELDDWLWYRIWGELAEERCRRGKGSAL